MGTYDYHWRCIWRRDGKYGGGNGGGARFGKGGGFPLHYNDRRNVFVGGTDGNCKGCGHHCVAEPEAESVFDMAVSGYSEGASGKGAHFDQYCRKSAGARLGMHAGRVKGDGGASGAACGELQTKISGAVGGACALRVTGNVHLSCPEYLIPAIDSGEYDRIQKSVRERQPGGDYRAGNYCDVGIHRGGTALCGSPGGT